MSNDDLVRRYAGRILELTKTRTDAVDQETLRVVATELGVDPTVIERAAEDHRIRAEGYCAHGRPDDAIAELEQATALAPLRLDIRTALAACLVDRAARSDDHDDDEERARAIARANLATDPRHEPSFALLNRLDGREQERKRKFGIIASVAVVLFMMISGLLAVSLSTMKALPSSTLTFGPRDAGSAGTTNAPAPNAAPTPTSLPSSIPSLSATAGEADLPLTIVGPHDDIELEARRAVIKRYPQHAYVEVQALVRSTRRSEITHVVWAITLVDDKGASVQEFTREAPASYEAPVFAGDVATLAFTVETAALVQGVQARIARMDEAPASAPPAGRPIALAWADKPGDLAITVRARHADITQRGGPFGPFFDAVYAFENTGTRSIRTLKVEVRGVDDNGRPLAGEDAVWSFYGVGSALPAMHPGDVRWRRVVHRVSTSFARAELRVVAFE